jgi:hypothetical protein
MKAWNAKERRELTTIISFKTMKRFKIPENQRKTLIPLINNRHSLLSTLVQIEGLQILKRMNMLKALAKTKTTNMTTQDYTLHKMLEKLQTRLVEAIILINKLMPIILNHLIPTFYPIIHQ